MLPAGGVCFLPGEGVLPPGGGASSQELVLPPRGVPGGDPPPGIAIAAGGTHPTGMHSCLLFNLETKEKDIKFI